MFKNTLLLLTLFFILSCDNSSEKAAEVTEAVDVKKLDEEEILKIKSYQIRPAESEVNWIGSKPAGKHYGSLGIDEGILYTVEDSIVGGKILINMDDIQVVDLKSDEDSHMKLVEHLKSADFFNVEKYPISKFEITEVLPYDINSAEESKYDYEEENQPHNKLSEEEYKPTHVIKGNLTLKGKTLNISFPAHLEIASNELTGNARFIIDRTQWGVTYREEAEFKDKAQDKLIYNDVVITLHILANPEQVNL